MINIGNNLNILTLENTTYQLNDIPEEVDDLRFGILDNSNPTEPDFFFVPLIFLESFNAPALVLKIDEQIIRMPVDWKILIGDKEVGDLEVLPLTSINSRGFYAFEFNPLSSSMASFPNIEIVDVYSEVRWFFPKTRPGQLLCTPLTVGTEPQCVYFVKDINRQSEIVSIQDVL